MGIIYGIFGMSALIAAYWASSWYTYGDGLWLVAVSMAPGAIAGMWSAYAVGMTMLPEMVGAYNGFGGLAAALEGYGLYLDPSSTYLVRNGVGGIPQTTPMVRWSAGN
jgi:NAD(P) transhydrogenase subunit beta